MDSAGCLLIADKCRQPPCQAHRLVRRSEDEARRWPSPEPVHGAGGQPGESDGGVRREGRGRTCRWRTATISRSTGCARTGRLQLALGVPPNRHALFEGYFDTVKADKLAQTPLHMPTGVVEASDGTIYFIERGYQAVRE